MSHGASMVDCPPGAKYGVMPRHGARQLRQREPFGTYFFGNLEDTVEFISANDLAFCCDVIRVVGDAFVWPMHSRGGLA